MTAYGKQSSGLEFFDNSTVVIFRVYGTCSCACKFYFVAVNIVTCHKYNNLLLQIFGFSVFLKLFRKRLNFYKSVIFPLQGHKLLMGTVFNDFTLVDDKYFVCFAKRGKACAQSSLWFFR